MRAEDAIAHFEARAEEHLADLESLVRIPSCSFPGHEPQHVRDAALATAALLTRRGFQNVPAWISAAIDRNTTVTVAVFFRGSSASLAFTLL